MENPNICRSYAKFGVCTAPLCIYEHPVVEADAQFHFDPAVYEWYSQNPDYFVDQYQYQNFDGMQIFDSASFFPQYFYDPATFPHPQM